ncbi:unnamed protein product [Amoebophrya sp. A25]|nr:unnamed protein product [Amoebophrya sp. A25]|eukprot:GSA25T00017049001.1
MSYFTSTATNRTEDSTSGEGSSVRYQRNPSRAGLGAASAISSVALDSFEDADDLDLKRKRRSGGGRSSSENGESEDGDSSSSDEDEVEENEKTNVEHVYAGSILDFLQK